MQLIKQPYFLRFMKTDLTNWIGLLHSRQADPICWRLRLFQGRQLFFDLQLPVQTGV